MPNGSSWPGRPGQDFERIHHASVGAGGRHRFLSSLRCSCVEPGQRGILTMSHAYYDNYGV